MMADVNKVFLFGRLTNDVRFGYMPNQVAAADFTLAVNRYYNDKSGEKQNEVCFIDCRAFGEPAKVIKNNTHKGKPIFIEGRLTLEIWTSKKTNTKQRKHRVIVESFAIPDMLGKNSTDDRPKRNTGDVGRPDKASGDSIESRRSGTERWLDEIPVDKESSADENIPF